MIADPMTAIVRVLSRTGAIAGTGFLAGAEPYVITCAHVVDAADRENSGDVTVELFHSRVRFQCRVVPRLRRDVKAEDIAALEIQLSPEARAELPRVGLGSSFTAIGADLRTFGFPPARGAEGAHATCVAIGRITEGGYDALQLQSSEVTYGFSGAPVWSDDINFVVGMVVSIIAPESDRGERMRETAFIRSIEVIRAVCELPLRSGQPYRGLAVFEEDAKDQYFGRDSAIRDVLTKLERGPTVLVTGVSGSGKSSFVRAGLARGFEKWRIPGISDRPRAVTLPSLTPLTTLLTSINELVPLGAVQLPRSESGTSAALATERGLSGASMTTALHAAAASKPMIVVIDQFERLFTNCPHEDIRRQFMDFIADTACDNVRFVMALRLDYSEVAQQHRLFRSLGESAVLLSQMTVDELSEAIMLPAASLGRGIEPAAVRALIADVRDRPGDLPLLQFALTELWEADNHKGVLTFDSYRKLGYETPAERITGAQGAIIRRAETEWNRLQVASSGAVGAREFLRLFLKLVQVSPGIAGPTLPASRRAWLAELDPDSQRHADTLANSFLLTSGSDPVSGQPTVEVAHEALIRNWSRLRVSIEQNQRFIAWYSAFGFDLQTWIRNRSYSLTGPALEAGLEWQKQASDLLAGPADAFISANRIQRLRKRIAIPAVTILALLGISAYLIARQRERIAYANDLRERGVAALAGRDFQSAELFLAKSLIIHDSREARQHLLDARADANPLVSEMRVSGPPIVASVSGHWIVVADVGKAVRVENPVSGKVFATPLLHDEHMRYAVSDDGRLLSYGNREGDLHVLTLTSSPQEQVWINKRGQDAAGVDSMEFSSDGRYLAVGRLDGHVELRDASNGKLIASTLAHRLAVHVVRFDPQKLQIASGGADRAVFLWDCSKSSATFIGAHADFIASLAFSPDGARLASGGADGAVRLWDLTGGRASSGGRLITSFLGHLGSVQDLAIMTSGIIVSGSEDGTLRLWDADAGGEVAQFDAGADVKLVFADRRLNLAVAATSNGFIRSWDLGRRDEGFTIYNPGPVSTVAISPGDKYMAAAGQDGTISVWHIDGSPVRSMSIRSDAPAIWSIAFTPDGEQIISGGEDGIARLWDIGTGLCREYVFGSDILQKKTEQGGKVAGNVWTIAVHPTQPYAAFGVAALDLSRVHIMDLRTWTEAVRIPHANASVWSIAFSHTGDMLALGSGDKTLDLWDTRNIVSPKPIKLMVSTGLEMWGVPFSPDDSALATAGLDRHVRIWTVPNLKVTKNFSRDFDHAGLVQSVDYSPTGQWIATASVDRNIKLWNPATGEVIPVGGHEGPSWWVVFSRSSDVFVSGGLDRRVVLRSLAKIRRVFDAPPGELFDEARRHTCRDLIDSKPRYVACAK